MTSGKIAPKAVVAGKLGANAVLPGNLGNGIITTDKLSDSAVIASKIKNGVVTTNKLNNGAVTTAKLGDGSVTLGKLADGVAPLLGTLKSGQTLRGVFVGSAVRTKSRPGSVSFQFPLLNPPAAPKENVLDVGKTSANCPGLSGASTPQANPRSALRLHHLEIGKIRRPRIHRRRDQPARLRPLRRVQTADPRILRPTASGR